MIDAMNQAMYLIEAWERGAYAEEYPNEITALRQAIEQAEKQKPNTTRKYQPEFRYAAPPMTPEHLPQYIATNNVKPMEGGGGGGALGSVPKREWFGLTNEEITALWCNYDASQFDKTVRSIEAKLRERNT